MKKPKHFITFFILAVLIFLLHSNTQSFSEESLNTTLIGHWPGGLCRAVAVSGDTVYFGNGGYLEIADFTDPANPVEMGRIVLPSLITDIMIRGNFAYTVVESGGMYIIDISDPENPVETGYCETGNYTRGIAVQENYAYVASAWQGMLIIDISDPYNPIEKGSYDPGNFAEDVTIKGNYAYIADSDSGLCIVNISDPLNPLKEGSYTGCNIYSVSVIEDYAYVSSHTDGFRILDISDPTSIIEVGFYNPGYYTRDVAVRGDYAYATFSAVLRIVDISNPSNPVEQGHIDLRSDIYKVIMNGNYVYAAAEDKGLRIIDVSTDPMNPTEVGFYDTRDEARSVSINGNYAYAADYRDGLLIIDISDPSHPVEKGHYEMSSQAYDVYIKGNYAYVASYKQGLLIIDISDPLHPAEIGSYDTGNQTYAVTVEGNYAYIADGDSGLCIIDISDPSEPKRQGSYNMEDPAREVTVSGDYAYVGGHQGLWIVDISDPSHPVQTAFYSTEDRVYGVAVSGNYAYIGENDLRIIDITDPSHPEEAGILSIVGYSIYGVAVQGNYAYLANYYNGLRIINISDPSHPQEIGFFDTGGKAYQVAVKENYVYIADGYDGLYIIRNDAIQEDSLHFQFTANTGQNCTIIVPSAIEPQYGDSTLLASGDEIGVFNSAGLCCGAVVWNQENAAITVWGDDEQTADTVDGFLENDTLRFRIWNSLEDKEYAARARFEDESDCLYHTDGYGVLAELIAESGTVTTPQAPYLGSPFQLPGLIELEDYDLGGKDVAYWDSDSGNTGGQYRQDDVDIEVVYDTSGSYDLCWTEDGEWLEYTVNSTGGTMDIGVRAATIHDGRQCRLLLDGDTLCTVDLPNTGGWQDWETATVKNILIPEGSNQIFRFEVVKGWVNLNWIKFTPSSGTGVSENTAIPLEFTLRQAYPNPFNPETTIEFHLPEKAEVRLIVYDITGREVCCLVQKTLPAGVHRVNWEGRDQNGQLMASGIYIYRLVANPTDGSGKNRDQIKKMIFMK